MLTLCANLQAGDTQILHAFVPAHPDTQDTIQLRTEVDGCFDDAVTFAVLEQKPAIEVRFYGSDVVCDFDNPDNFITPRFLAIGTLPAGTYATRIYACGFGPMGEICQIVQEGTLTVTQATSAAAVVPGLSPSGIALLASLSLLLGWIALRRH